MRYAWDLREAYLRETGLDRGVSGWIARRLLERLRRWDQETAGRPTQYLAISDFIADRIGRAYGRRARILYPPVDTDFFRPGVEGHVSAGAPYWLTASRFVPYKRIPLIAEAFAGMPSRRLLVVGDGPERLRVEAVARDATNVTLLGQVSRERLRELIQGAQAFVFAAEEDFGIAPVEALACGVPVVAYAKGGAQETVQGDPALPECTGVYFKTQTVDGIRGGVDSLEALRAAGRITAVACRARAERFSVDAFRAGLRAEVSRVAGHLAQTVVSS
jgi:glycosyltransferase involved in cell wall biosynthesis